MVIVNSGVISLADLRAEFVGGTGTISLGDLYRNNANNYTIAIDGIPASGTTIDLGNFYGKAKVANYNNLVLFLDAKNTLSYPGSGTLWTDLSTKANNVTLYSCTYATNNGGVIKFSGTTASYAYKSTFSSYNSGNWTSILWIYVRGNYSSVIMQLSRSPADANTEFVWYFNRYWDYDSAIGGYGLQITPSNAPNSVNWYQVAFVKNGTSCTCYLNGSSCGTATGLNASYSTNDFCIGKDYRDGTTYGATCLYGDVSFIMIYNYSMTAAEISANYNNYRGRFGI